MVELYTQLPSNRYSALRLRHGQYAASCVIKAVSLAIGVCHGRVATHIHLIVISISMIMIQWYLTASQ